MRILIGSESFYPNISGVSVFAFQLARNLKKMGHDVAVCAPSKNRTNYSETDPIGHFPVYRFSSIPNPFRRGFRVASRPYRQALHVVAEFKPDIFHLQDPTSICASLHKIGRAKGIPVVATYHFSLEYILSYIRPLKPFFPIIRRIITRYLNRFYNTCDVVTCPTETIKKVLLKQGITVKIHALSNGVDLERFFPFWWRHAVLAKYHLPWPEPPIVLYAGRHDLDKSIPVLLQAIPLVLQKTNAHFVFLGGGDRLSDFRQWVHAQKLDRYVTFTGLLPHESVELVQLYQAAQLFVIPSTIETQSIVTMEAMAAGKPVVAAKAGALPELVRDNQNGLLVKPHDVAAFADAIATLLKDTKRRARMSEKSLEIVGAHELKQSLQLFVQLYKAQLKHYEKNKN